MPAGGLNVKDMTNLQIGDLKVLERASSKRKLATWRCLCPCGKEFVAVGTEIRNGKTRTCGCKISIKNRRNWQGYEGISKTYWRRLGQNAIQRSLEFSISVEDMWELLLKQQYRCAISGLLLSLSLDHHTASVDRIDSGIGYVSGNVQWVHRDVNKLKGTFSMERLVELCRLIANYQV